MSRKGEGHDARLLAALTAAQGATVSAATLLQAMYGPMGRPPGAAKVLQVAVCHLRTKLPGNQRIVHVRGRAGAFGYRLEVLG